MAGVEVTGAPSAEGTSGFAYRKTEDLQSSSSESGLKSTSELERTMVPFPTPDASASRNVSSSGSWSKSCSEGLMLANAFLKAA